MPPRIPGQVLAIELPDDAVSFDVDQFDNAIRNHGVTFEHWRAMACPVGMTDENGGRRPHEDHSGCSNGFLYTKAGEITCLFTGNGTSAQFGPAGILDGSTVSVTAPRTYDGSDEPLYIAPFDRLFLAEPNIVVPDWQRFRCNNVREKLRYPVVRVLDLVDADNRRYTKADFTLEAGQIVWTGNRPGVDPTSGKGLIATCAFVYRPYWYVKHLVHEVRVAQANHPITGAREIVRMPQALVLQREYVFEKNDNDELAPDKPRQVQPPDGQRFGPR